MTHWVGLFVWNLIVFVVVALAVWLLCRTPFLRRRPALRHGLWVFVLLKLVTPPLVPVTVLPAAGSDQDVVAVAKDRPVRDGESADALSGAPSESVNTGATPSFRQRDVPIHEVAELAGFWSELRIPDTGAFGSNGFQAKAGLLCLLVVSLTVSLVIWYAGLRQFRLLRRLLPVAAVESGREVDLLRDVSRRFDLRRELDLFIVDASVAPMLWVASGQAIVVLPRNLANSLSDAQLRNVFAHEVAHYVRRDHWAHWLAFVVTSLYWWNPVVWLARRELTDAGEASCDALAIARLGGLRKTFAATLMAVVDTVNSNGTKVPALSVTFGVSQSINSRVRLIADSHVRSRLPRCGWFVFVLSAAMLPLVPIRAQEQPASTPASPVSQTDDPGDIPSKKQKSKRLALPVRALHEIDGPLDSKLVVARVNGDDILLRDMLARYRHGLEAARIQHGEARFRSLQVALLRRDLPNHIDQTLMAQAMRASLTREQWTQIMHYLDRQFARETKKLIKQRDVSTKDELNSELSKQGDSLEQLRREFVRQRLCMEWFGTRILKVAEKDRESALKKLLKDLRDKAEIRTVFDDAETDHKNRQSSRIDPRKLRDLPTAH